MGGIGRSMKVWLDDVRPAPDGWVLAKNYNEAITLLESGRVIEIDLDYDLNLVEVATQVSGLAIARSDAGQRTGYDVARWIEDAVANGRIPKPVMHCHSVNPVGQMLITAVIERFSQ